MSKLLEKPRAFAAYLYAISDPLNNVDADGLEPQKKGFWTRVGQATIHFAAEAVCMSLGGCGYANAPEPGERTYRQATAAEVALNLTAAHVAPRINAAIASRILKAPVKLQSGDASAAPPISRKLPTGNKDDYGLYVYKWDNDPRALVKFKLQGNTVLVDHVIRGGQPKGSAGNMLADALRKAGVSRPTEMFAPNVLNKSPDSMDVIDNVMRNAASDLGGTVTYASRGIERSGKQWVQVSISYGR